MTTLDGSEFIPAIQSFILQMLKTHKQVQKKPCKFISFTYQPSQQPCNISSLKGEMLSITSGAVESCLGSGADRILFDALVEAALASEDLGFGWFRLGMAKDNFFQDYEGRFCFEFWEGTTFMIGRCRCYQALCTQLGHSVQ